MTTFARMDNAIAYAVDNHAAGSIITMERVTLNTEEIDETRAYTDDATAVERSYLARVHAGAVIPEVYRIIVANLDGAREWAGDIHIYRRPNCEYAEPLFFYFYAA